jgi:hypothetical protein
MQMHRRIGIADDESSGRRSPASRWALELDGRGAPPTAAYGTGGKPIGCGMAASLPADFLPASRTMRVGVGRLVTVARVSVEIDVILAAIVQVGEDPAAQLHLGHAAGARNREGAGATAAHDLDG